MYHNYLEPNGSFIHSLKDVDLKQAVLLHPVKEPRYQYRLHRYFASITYIQQLNKLYRLQKEIKKWTKHDRNRDGEDPVKFGIPPTLTENVTMSRNEVLSWYFISKSMLYSSKSYNPCKTIDPHFQSGIIDAVIKLVNHVGIKSAHEHGQSAKFKDIQYGYGRVDPVIGAEYIFELCQAIRKLKSKRKISVPEYRRVYVQQPFLEVHFIEENQSEELESESKRSKIASNSVIQGMFGVKRKQIDDDRVNGKNNMRVNFILPMCGLYKTFLQFIYNFEDACLKKNENVSLLVMLFHSEEDDRTEDTITNVRALQDKYPQQELKVVLIQGTFSRGIARQKGSSMLAANQLLFFIDVDMYIQSDSLWRIRLNTIQGKQVYYPIVFSQYDPQLICENETETDSCPPRSSSFSFDSNNGYWYLFGNGIAAMYNSDFQNIGGFDQDIKGWGKEDVSLMEKYILSNFTVFRSVDVGLVHIFHSILCDPSFDRAQYQMCLGIKAASYASTEKLASVVYKTSEIFNRNEISRYAHQEAINFQEARHS